MGGLATNLLPGGGLDRAIKCLEDWGLQRCTAAITMSSGR